MKLVSPRTPSSVAVTAIARFLVDKAETTATRSVRTPNSSHFSHRMFPSAKAINECMPPALSTREEV